MKVNEKENNQLKSNKMKKLIYLVSTVLALAFASCNKNAGIDVETTKDSSELMSLKEQLIALNTTLPQSQDIAVKAKWWHYVLVAAADAGGFFLGGGASAGAVAVTAGCTVSTLVWNIVKEDEKKETKGSDSSNFEPFNDREVALSCVEGVGLIHNKVILDLYEDHGESLFGYEDDVLLPLVAEKVSSEIESSQNEVSLSVQEQKDIVSATVNAYASSSTIGEFIASLELSAPEKSALLEVVSVILEGFDSIDAIDDNGEYSSAVQELISDSDVSEEAKEILVSTTSVANASARLWKVE